MIMLSIYIASTSAIFAFFDLLDLLAFLLFFPFLLFFTFLLFFEPFLDLLRLPFAATNFAFFDISFRAFANLAFFDITLRAFANFTRADRSISLTAMFAC